MARAPGLAKAEEEVVERRPYAGPADELVVLRSSRVVGDDAEVPARNRLGAAWTAGLADRGARNNAGLPLRVVTRCARAGLAGSRAVGAPPTCPGFRDALDGHPPGGIAIHAPSLAGEF